jgi:hypothetical protein
VNDTATTILESLKLSHPTLPIMAFQYRTSAETVLSKFTSEEQSRITKTAVNNFEKKEKFGNEHFAYHLSDYAKQKLSESGVYLSPFSFVTHSHPACKTLENHLLLNVLPSYIDNSFFVVSMKDSKLAYLRNRSKMTTLQSLNRFVTSKDIFRYGSDNFFIEKAKKKLFSDNYDGTGTSVKDLIPSVLRVKGRRLLLHDELHYWNLRELDKFLEAVEPEVIVATHIFPKEILMGQTTSLNKWLYEFKIRDDLLTFFPDGRREEAYEQPIDGGMFLHMNNFVTSSGVNYTVSVVYSLYSHSVIQISRCKLKVEKFRHFSGFNATDGIEVTKFGGSIKNIFPVRPELIRKIYLYLRTLKKPDLESAMAKLRQSVDEPSGAEIIFVENFATFLLKHKTSKILIEDSLFHRVGEFLIEQLPVFLRKHFETYYGDNIAKFIEELKEAEVNIECVTMNPNSGTWVDYFPSIDFLNLNFLRKVNLSVNEHDAKIQKKLVQEGRSRYKYSLPYEKCTKLIHVIDKYEYLRDVIFALYERKISLKKMRSELLHLLRVGINGKNLESFWSNHISRLYENDCIQKLLDVLGEEIFLESIHNREKKSLCGTGVFSQESVERKRVFGEQRILDDVRITYGSVVKDLVNYMSGLNIIKAKFDLSCSGDELRKKKGDEKQITEESVNDCKVAEIAIEDQMGNFDFSAILESFKQPGQELEVLRKQSEELVDVPISVDCGFGLGRESVFLTSDPVCDSSKKKVTDSTLLLHCSCGMGIEKKHAEIEPNLEWGLQFPDQLKGRQVGYYSKKSDDSYSCYGGNKKSLAWSSDLDLIIQKCDGKFHNYDSCLAQKCEPETKLNFFPDRELAFPKKGEILIVNLVGEAIFSTACMKGKVDFTLASGHFFYPPSNFLENHKSSIKTSSKVVTLLFINFSSSDAKCSPQRIASKEEERINGELPTFSDYQEHYHEIRYGSICQESRRFKIGDINNFNEFKVTGDGDCFWHCLSCILGGSATELREICKNYLVSNDMNFDSNLQLESKVYAETEVIHLASTVFELKIVCFDSRGQVVEYQPADGVVSRVINLILDHSHFNLLIPKEGCVVRAIADSLNRDHLDILKVLARKENIEIMDELNEGSGLPTMLLDKVFKTFGIRATVEFENEVVTYNTNGKLFRNFQVFDGHIVFRPEHNIEGHKKMGSTGVKVERDVNFGRLMKEVSGGNEINYEVDYNRAKLLQGSFLAGHSGKILSEVFSGQKEWIKEYTNHKVKCFVSVGTFGSGKSYAIKQIVKTRDDIDFVIISPRKRLAEQFKMDIGVRNRWRSGIRNNCDVLTFEVALKRKISKGKFVIIDELQLFPPGYFDLLCIRSKLENVVIIGDPLQSSYDNESDRHLVGELENDLINVLQGNNYKYLIKSRRFKNSLYVNRLPCSFDRLERYPTIGYDVFDDVSKCAKEIRKGDAVLCSSFDEKTMMYYALGRGKLEVMTYGESTGLTFRKGCILLTQNTALVDDKRMLVALSRFSEEINFINLTGQDFKEFIQSLGSGALYKFCTEKASVSDIKDALPGNPTLVNEYEKLGSDEVDREARMLGDPWLKTMIFTGQRETVIEEFNEVNKVVEERALTHLPINGQNSAQARIFDRMKDKSYREVRIGGLQTEQFRDSYHPKDWGRVSNQCDLFEAIYPRHSGSDTATFLMAARKRLTFADPNVNGKKLREAKPYGVLMFKHFTRFIRLRNNRSETMLAECVREFEEKKLQKAAATIENHSGRSNRDWNIREAFVFMKSQLCTKFDNRFRDAKAGQTLACFSHIVLCRFAPWIRYIEKKVLEVMPQNFYIHSGKNFDQLEAWVLANDFSGECTESDYEAFDASQDATILAFELEVMSFLNVPNDVIEDYKFIKLNLYSKLGLFAVMRFTGEAGTFLFNTMANMCFTFMRYKLRGTESIAFAGDDMCANSRLRVSNEFEHILSRMKLKAKVDYKKEASFCGWTLGSFGIYKKPQLVLERFEISKERGTLSECIDNYAIEVSYGYKLGDKIFDFMSEEEVEYQNMCIRIIIKNQKLIRSNALDLFSGERKRNM